ncbi:hypothetical Protein YC6258_00070 [Gynuella sunshinyii YC6258]|uniref:Uncharacterized protein n=1 Tax=Gynuella sunshinyii YC6258 TaxID=1445510 RepID=A0A0C5VCZ5_9GAMM|nr:hypothetical Protein YC6258_00070 [Gynuella sunshinyii YC6258]
MLRNVLNKITCVDSDPKKAWISRFNTIIIFNTARRPKFFAQQNPDPGI